MLTFIANNVWMFPKCFHDLVGRWTSGPVIVLSKNTLVWFLLYTCINHTHTSALDVENTSGSIYRRRRDMNASILRMSVYEAIFRLTPDELNDV